MLLRICLIVAILGGAGVIAVSHFMVRPQVENIMAERQKNADDRDAEKKAKVTALAKLKATEGKLKDTETNLEQTKTQLAAAKTQVEAEQKRGNALKQDLEKTRVDLTDTQQKLARWDGIGLDPSQVKGLIQSEKDLRNANKGLDEEKKLFAKKYKEADAQLKQILGDDKIDPPMRVGLNGKVLVVDPKWSFVVLDIGEKDGAVQNGVLMISRNSKLIAKVRIMSLQSERSIANIIPGWKLGEVLEGDHVLY